MKKNRIIAIVMCLVVMVTLLSALAGCSATQEEIPIPTVEKDVYVYDQDDIISDDIEEELNKMLTKLEDETEVEFAVISIESLLGRDIESYANKLFNTLGIGKDDKDNGVLLLFSRSDEKVRLEIGLGLEGCLNDSKCGRILDNNFVPYRENDEYTTATEMTVKAVVKVISEEYGIEIDGLENFEENESEEDEVEELPDWFWIVVIIIAILYIWATWNEDGGYSGSSYGGGRSYGGGSSRSSFGGGRSGGGGASR